MSVLVLQKGWGTQDQNQNTEPLVDILLNVADLKAEVFLAFLCFCELLNNLLL